MSRTALADRIGFVVVLVLALEAAVWECFLVPAHPWGMAAALAVAGNLVLGRAGGRLVPGGAIGPGLCWLVITIPLSMKGPLGDLVVPGDSRGVLFLVAGVAAAAVAVGGRGGIRATPSGDTRR